MYFMVNPLLLSDVKPGAAKPGDSQGVIYYIDKKLKDAAPLPSTVGATGFAAIALSTAKSSSPSGGKTCVTAIGFPRSKIDALRKAAGPPSFEWDGLFPTAYDYIVATPTGEKGTFIKEQLLAGGAAEAERLMPQDFKSYGGVKLTVSFNVMSASIVMGSASGDPLLYFFFNAVDSTYSCGNNGCTGAICPSGAGSCLSAPYGDVLMGLRATLSISTSGALDKPPAPLTSTQLRSAHPRPPDTPPCPRRQGRHHIFQAVRRGIGELPGAALADHVDRQQEGLHDHGLALYHHDSRRAEGRRFLQHRRVHCRRCRPGPLNAPESCAPSAATPNSQTTCAVLDLRRPRANTTARPRGMENAAARLASRRFRRTSSAASPPRLRI